MTKMDTITAAGAAGTDVLAAVKAKQNVAWGSGDYAKIGVTLQIVGERLAESVDVAPGAEVLDVAAGNGNATLAFARRWGRVTSTDYVPALLEQGRVRAEAEGHDIAFQTADAEALPFADDSFDATVSTFGVMFTPDQEQAAAEMIRVTRPGGRIGLANWTPESFIGRIFRIIGRHLPPPAGVQSPARWGTRAWIDEVFGPHVAETRLTGQSFTFRYASADHFIDFFRTWYGPTERAFAAVGPEGAPALERDLRALIEEMNVATDGTMKVPAAYAEIVMTVR